MSDINRISKTTCLIAIVALTAIRVQAQELLRVEDTTQLPRLNQGAELNSPDEIPAQLLDDSNVLSPQPIRDPAAAWAAETDDSSATLSKMLSRETESFMSRKGTGSTIKAVVLLGALSLAPAIVLMTTCYIRIIVVLGLLRQAFGSQQLPPTQVLTALSLFLTLLVMAPVWNEVKREAIDPYSHSDSISWEEAWIRGIAPVKKFMSRQIEIAQNGNAIAVFYNYLPKQQQRQRPESFDDVPITVLLPAFVVSELKVAFLLGFQIYLPFLVLDLVVSTVTVSMGMLMLPPTMISFPLKLILFVMVDGWNLVIGMLLQSIGPYS